MLNWASMNPLNKLAKTFYLIFCNGHEQYFFLLSVQEFSAKYVNYCLKKNILYSTAFKYRHYKKVFLDENPKTRFSDMKTQESRQKKILKLLSDLVSNY